MRQVDWLKFLSLVPQVENAVTAFEAAVSLDEKAKAVGVLTELSISVLEVVTGKDLVDNEKLDVLVQDVLKAILDAEALENPKV